MKKTTVILAAVLFALSAPMAIKASEHEHGSMHNEHEHGSMHEGHEHGMAHGEHEHGMMSKGKTIREELVDGVKATFRLISMAEMMKGSEMPKGMKETHHLMVEFRDAKSGKALVEGEVKVKVVGPDKAEQTKDLMGMEGHFGADISMAKKGKYGIMTKFKVKDGKVRSAKFWYAVK